MNHKTKTEYLLDGKLSVTEAQSHLSELSREDLAQLYSPEQLNDKMAAYRNRNRFQSGAEPRLEVQEIDRMWSQIRLSTPPRQSRSRLSDFMDKALTWLKDSLVNAPLRTYGATLAAMLVLSATIPLMFQNWGNEPSLGMKGHKVETPVHLQYAIVGSNGVLQRPERQLFEIDTLAFRLTVEREGYYSLYLIHQNNVDPVIANKHLPEGTHDLQEAYALKGNAGVNRIVIVSSDHPLGEAVQLSPEFILQAALNQVRRVTINEQELFFQTQSIEVEMRK